MYTFLKWITRYTFEHLYLLSTAHSSQPCSPCYRLALSFCIRSFDLGCFRQYSQLLYLRYLNQLPITLSTHFCDVETCFKISRFITSYLSTRYRLLRFRSNESVCVFCQTEHSCADRISALYLSLGLFFGLSSAPGHETCPHACIHRRNISAGIEPTALTIRHAIPISSLTNN